MGLQTDIGYEPVRPNVLQRVIQTLGATRVGTAAFSPVLSHLDRALFRLSHGRTTAGATLGAFPVVMLTTTGARTGLRRTTPLTAIPLRGDLALLGSNYGSETTPAWAHNLRSHPAASIAYKGRTHDVIARPADAGEVEDAFRAAIAIYPGYADYRDRTSREIPVFVLTPVEE